MMGRLAIVEKSAEKSLMDFDGAPWCIGLLVGGVTEQRDYIIHFAITPIEDKDRADRISELSDILVTTHASELLRMLPGGLCICGIAAVGLDLSSHYSKLQQIMTATYKSVSKSDIHGTHTDCWQLILVDKLSKKVSSKSLLVSDYKSTLMPSEVRFQSLNTGWVVAKANLSINRNFYVCRKQENDHFEQQLLEGLTPYFEDITDSLCLCNGAYVDEDEQFGTAPGKGKKSSQDSLTPTTVQVKLLRKMKAVSSSCCKEKVSAMWLVGSMSAVAFLRAPATALQVSQAIKSDLKKSLTVRCKLLCEDILQVSSEKHSLDDQMIYETPPRVYIPHISVPQLAFNDHMFKDEKVEDCVERAQQILGIESIHASSIDTTTERAAELEDIEDLNSTIGDSSREQESDVASQNSFLPSMRRLVPIASGAAIALAVSLSYLSIDEWFG